MDYEWVLCEISNNVSCASQPVHAVPERHGGGEKVIPVTGGLEGLLADGVEQRPMHSPLSCFMFPGQV